MASDLVVPGPATRVIPSATRHWPAPWLFAVPILPLGMYLGFIRTALPLLLSKAGVSVEDISRISAVLQIPPVLTFLWTSVVDVKLRRRTWLLLAAAAAFACMWTACPLTNASHLNSMATMLSATGQSQASAWNMAGNFGGGVLGAAVSPWLAQRVSLPFVGLAAALLVVLPSLAALSIRETPPIPTHWFRGRFRPARR